MVSCGCIEGDMGEPASAGRSSSMYRRREVKVEGVWRPGRESVLLKKEKMLHSLQGEETGGGALADGPDERSAVGGAVRGEDAEVDEPGARVELGVDGLDEPGLGTGSALRLHDDVAGDDLRALGGAPADHDGALAGVPEVQDLEGDRGLGALTFLEGLEGVEGGLAEWLGSRAAGVDELGDGVGVVDEVGGEGLVSQGVRVVGDQGLEVVGDDGGLLVGHAGLVAVALLEGGGNGTHGEGGHGDDGAAHDDGWVGG